MQFLSNPEVKPWENFQRLFCWTVPQTPQLTGRIFVPSLVTYQLLPQ